MEDVIFTMGEDGQPKPLKAQPFGSEDKLQALIAEHPELLAWEQMNPGGTMRWILVRREMGIAKDAGAGDWWAVDHLFIDQDAVPTLVEVKRGTNPEIRRKVVGQMLEYAAHAWQTWTADSLRQTFEEASADKGDRELRELLDVDDEDDESWRSSFWQSVGDNLAAKRLRLLFVADDIPDELTRIVEFLNASMPNVEVLAVEIKKFDGNSGLRTLVPRVIGRTAKPTATKSEKLDRDSFLAKFENERERSAAERLLDLAGKYQSVKMGTTSLVIRYPRPGAKWVSVAWISPPGVQGWIGLKDFTFGHLPFSDNDSLELQELLGNWRSQFSDDEFAEDVSAKWGSGCRVTAKNAALHIDTLATRVDKVLSDLRSLGDTRRLRDSAADGV